MVKIAINFQHEISLSVAGHMYLYAVMLEVMVTTICLTLQAPVSTCKFSKLISIHFLKE